MKILKFVKSFVSQYKNNIVLYVVVSYVLCVIGIALPVVTAEFLDLVFLASDRGNAYLTVKVLLFLWIIQIILSYINNVNLTKVHSRVFHVMSKTIMKHISNLPMRFFSAYNPSYLNDRINSDMKSVLAFALGGVTGVSISLFTIVGASIIILRTNITIFLLMLAIVPLYIGVYYCFRDRIYLMKRKLSEQQSGFYAQSNKLFININTIKVHEWQDYYFNEFSAVYSELHKRLMSNAILGYFFSNIGVVLRCMANIIVFIYCGFHAFEGSMTVGEFTMINTYSLMIIGRFEDLLNFSKYYQEVCVSYDRLIRICSEQIELDGINKVDAVNGIIVEGLSFKYDGSQIIDDLNVNFEKGKIYCVIGSNGSGKSTLLKLLCGIEGNYEGKIYYNGINIENLDMRDIRKNHISFVEQEPKLLYDDIDYCDTFLRNKYDMLVKKFGLDTEQLELKRKVPDYEKELSGGEKQKLSIINALLKDKEVLIMDEPNSSVDKQSLNVLIQMIIQLKQDKVIIVVTHSKEVIEIADFVVEL